VIDEVNEIGRFENEVVTTVAWKKNSTTLRHIIKTICKGIPTDTLAILKETKP
jgi:hypothetical protein